MLEIVHLEAIAPEAITPAARERSRLVRRMPQVPIEEAAEGEVVHSAHAMKHPSTLRYARDTGAMVRACDVAVLGGIHEC